MPAALLIVDADHGSRTSLAALLRDCGHPVDEAANGADGLRLARQKMPALVIIDPWPFVSAAAQMVRHVQASRPAPAVLVVTSAPQSQQHVRSRFSAYLPWLEKPCSPIDLLVEVDHLLKRSAENGVEERRAPEAGG